MYTTDDINESLEGIVIDDSEPHGAKYALSEIRVSSIGLVPSGSGNAHLPGGDNFIILKNQKSEDKNMAAPAKNYSVRLSGDEIQQIKELAEAENLFYCDRPSVSKGIHALISKVEKSAAGVDILRAVYLALSALHDKSVDEETLDLSLNVVEKFLGAEALKSAIDCSLDPANAHFRADDPIEKICREKKISYSQALLSLPREEQFALMDVPIDKSGHFGDYKVRTTRSERLAASEKNWLDVLSGPNFQHLTNSQKKNLAAKNAELEIEASA